jgi:hypothetical protein
VADIRKSTAPIDDFERAPESPLSFGGQWALTDSVWSQGLQTKLTGGSMRAVEPAAGSKFGSSYWIPLVMDGDDAEFWAHATGGNYPGIRWEVGLVSSPGGSSAFDGYTYRRDVTTAGGSTFLRKWTNGVGTNLVSAGPHGTSGTLMMIRRNGNSVECWQSDDGGPTWTFIASAVDTSYMTGLHGALMLSDNSRSFGHAFDDAGGGAQVWQPEFIRRPWRFTGVGIDV